MMDRDEERENFRRNQAVLARKVLGLLEQEAESETDVLKLAELVQLHAQTLRILKVNEPEPPAAH